MNALRCVSCLVASIAVVASCGGRVASPCRQTLDAYCSNPLTPCVRHVDPTDVAGSYCSQPGAQSGLFGLRACPSVVVVAFEGSGPAYDRNPGDVPLPSYGYDQTSGELLWVDSFVPTAAGDVVTCEAGTSAPDLHDCDDDLVADGCN